MSITVTQETIGPSEASKYLAKTNTHNRNVVERRVHIIARDIVNDRFAFNGDSIKFSNTDVLLDGQHRLLAVVEADKPILTVVVRGLDNEAQETMDIGAKRSLQDVLTLRGEHYTAAAAAISRLSWQLDTFGEPATDPRTYPSQQDLLAYFDTNRDKIMEFAPLAYQGSASVLHIAPSITGALAFQMDRRDPAKGAEFWRRLLENDAPKGSPIFALRESLIKDLGRLHRIKTNHKLALFIKAWNAWIEGKTGMEFIFYRPSGPMPEEFPRLADPKTPRSAK